MQEMYILRDIYLRGGSLTAELIKEKSLDNVLSICFLYEYPSIRVSKFLFLVKSAILFA